MIKIKKITLREVVLELVEPFAISSGTITHRRVFLLEVEDSSGAVAWSECVAKGMPNYSPETIDMAWDIISKWIAPNILNKSFESAQDILPFINKTVRGNYMAKAAIEMAGWCLEAIQANQSLATYIGGTQKEIETGVSLGIQDSPEILVQKVKRSLDEGYKKVKIKISPGQDLDYIQAVRDELGPDCPIMVDANNAYTLADLPLLKELDKHNLLMIEQPLAWDDIMEHRHIQKELKTPVCLDESIIHLASAQQAIEFDCTRIINVKPGRVGGFSQAIAIHDLCQEKGIPVWCGGMLESGVGRAYNVALASLPNFTLPGDLSPSKRYWKQDIVTPEWTMTEGGMMTVPHDKVGLGVEVDKARVESLAERTSVLEA